jgi:hypothetical protein
MISLKAFAPILADLLALTPAAIYERQRALIRAGVLPAPVGRGRGNGLPATAETAALMLIAIMVTDNLSDTDGRVQRLSDAKLYRHPERGPRLKGASTFRAALIAILNSDKLAAEIGTIEVFRNNLSANVYFGDRISLDNVTRFGDQRLLPKDNLYVTAWLDGSVMKAIGKALKNDPNGKSAWR